ncbi:hypothetical protein G6Z17_15005, partial [Clostridium perfringens]|uniref:condensation domain-containing protein n=1 Tax=Clostridium perfringens TaxID=1502 RepID=UPI0013E2FF19
MINRQNIKYIYELTSTQNGILFDTLVNNDDTYLEQILIEVSGNLKIDLLEKSLNIISKRHDILRTIFLTKIVNGPMQVVLKEYEHKIKSCFLKSVYEVDKENEIQEFLKLDRKKVFNLEKEVPIRLTVINGLDDKYRILMSFHHIILDGWSMANFTEEIFKIYEELTLKVYNDIEYKYSFKDYIDILNKNYKKESKDFWNKYLEKYEENDNLNISIKNDNKKMNCIKLKINKEYIDKLNQECINMNTTINIIIQSIWGIVLQKYNNKKDVVFSTISCGRDINLKNIEKMIGMFMNNIPIRIKSYKEDTVRSLIKRTNEEFNYIKENENFRALDCTNDEYIKSDLKKYLFVTENYPISNLLKSDRKTINIESVKSFSKSDYDVSLVVEPGQEYILNFNYNENIYDENCIFNFYKTFIYI